MTWDYTAPFHTTAYPLLNVAVAAIVETMMRLDRRLPVDAVGHGGSHPSERIFVPIDVAPSDAETQARREHLALELVDARSGSHAPPADRATAAVSVVALLAHNELRVRVTCHEDEPWWAMRGAVAEMFAEIFSAVVTDPSCSPAKAPGLGLESYSRVLTELAGKAVDYGAFTAVPAMIENAVDRYPDRPAVTFGERTLTYRAFDDLANALAWTLTARGVTKGDVVPVIMTNCLEMPIAYYALMKLGAAFVPFDTAWPLERMRLSLEVISPKVVLCTSADGLPDEVRETTLPVDIASLDGTPRRPDVVVAPDDLIYGIFTSGTTGTPKCALNVHYGLWNRFNFMNRYFGSSGEVTLQNSRSTFDSSVWQMFWPLTVGGQTVIPRQGEILDVEDRIDAIAAHRVTMTCFVPTNLDMLVSLVEQSDATLKKLSSLRTLVVGGEEMNPRHVYKLQSLLPGLRAINAYGPTEASIGMAFHDTTSADGEKVPLGRPLDNCYAIIVDDELRPLPVGARGNIVIGGACLGRGYLGDPTRTMRAFLVNPFPEIPSERLYWTGDVGFFGEDGNLRFVGRKDSQVKIGGLRIELGEIAAVAQACPHVRQAEAIVTGEGPSKAIVLFVSGDAELLEDELRAFLDQRLPRNHRPRHCFVLPRMPSTQNGKVDTRQLLVLLPGLLASRAPVRLEVEEGELGRVAHAFRVALGQPHISPSASFLSSGGDSLQALALVEALSSAFGVPLFVQDLFAQPTPEAMHRLIERRRGEVAHVGPHTEIERDVVLPRDVMIRGPSPDAVRTVLVTGANGFIGSRITHELLAGTDVRVIALCRAADDGVARKRMVDALTTRHLWRDSFAARLYVFAADLARPSLDLASSVWNHLSRSVDLVVHNGAMVNFLFDYGAHRPANVLGTTELLRLAHTERPKAFHYVSTLGVLDAEVEHHAGPLPESLEAPGARMPASGYSRSKWIAERCLNEARRMGAAVTILRLGEVMPASDNGAPNRTALTHFVLRAFHRLGACPTVSMMTDYSPVDYVATRIVAAIEDRETWGKTMHVFHPERVCLTQVLPQMGAPIDRVSCVEFLARLDDEITKAATRDLVNLRALLPKSLDHDEAAIERAFSALVVDNPRHFRRDECAALERRAGLSSTPLGPALAAYYSVLSRGARRVESGGVGGEAPDDEASTFAPATVTAAAPAPR